MFNVAADAARSVRDVLRTVAQCHARNVLIRDVKPDNFLYLTSDEEAPLKAIDFGLAQYCKPDESLRDKAGMASLTCGVKQKMMFVHMFTTDLSILSCCQPVSTVG